MIALTLFKDFACVSFCLVQTILKPMTQNISYLKQTKFQNKLSTL